MHKYVRLFTEPQKKGGGGASLLVVIPRIFSTLSGSQSSVAHPANTTQHCFTCFPARSFSLTSYDFIPFISFDRQPVVMSRNIYLLEKIEKNNTPSCSESTLSSPGQSSPRELPAEICGYVDCLHQ